MAKSKAVRTPNQICDVIDILAMVPGHLYWKNLKGEFMGCNDLQALDLGLKCREDIIGLTDYDILPKEEADAIRKVDLQVVATGEAVIVEEWSTYSGVNKIWLSRKTPLRDKAGNIIGIIGTSLDITDRKEKERLELEIQAQQDKIAEADKLEELMDIIAKAPGHLYWKNLKGEIQGCNDLQATNLGMKSREDIVGLTDYDLLSENEARALHNNDIQVITTGKAIVIEERAIINNGRETIWLSRKEPLRDKNGNIIGIIGTSLDITDRKEKELLEKENQAYYEQQQEQQQFLKFVEEMQHLMNNYKVNALYKSTGQKPPRKKIAEIQLTRREKQILYYCAMGKQPKIIANILGKQDNKELSPATIQSVIDSKLYVKLECNNMVDLVERAQLYNLIPLEPPK